jgi:uncharacterized protein (TIGR00725 family)
MPKVDGSTSETGGEALRIKIGVMGSAGGELNSEVCEKVYQLGKEIARHDCVVVTGGCPGLPFEATRGAKEAGGMTVGISPGLDLEEHVNRYHSPVDFLDILIFTGSGLMGREVIAVRSCDILIIVGGRSGTLGEFSIAYDEGKVIGVLEGTGGITTEIQDIVGAIQKQTGSKIVYSSDPAALVQKLIGHFYNTSDGKFLLAAKGPGQLEP